MLLENEYLRVEFSTIGGAMTSIKDKDGVEYLWQGNPQYWSGQAPVLFPICGSLRNDKALFSTDDAQEFWGRIPRHGIVRKSDFELERINENSLAFNIKAGEETLRNYPYNFDLKIIYTLTGKTIRTEYQVTNKEVEQLMPYFIGGHPGFNCPLIGDSYEDYYLEFDEVETCTVPKQFPDTGLLDLLERQPFLDNQKRLDLDYTLFSHDAITLDRLQSRGVTLRSTKHDKGLRVDFADFPNLVLWSTTDKSPFIALEPWSGLSTSLDEGDIFEEKRQVTIVESGQTRTKFFDITIL